jgi:hypothetical protein
MARQAPASPTCEDFDEFCATYPDFQLKDELDFDGGGNVMYRRTFFRRRRARDVRRAAEHAERTREERDETAADD